VPGSRSGLAMFLGGVSYPLYLNHWIGAFAAHALFGHAGLGARLASYAFGLSAGVVAYLLVDRPVMAWRGALFSKMRGRICAATAYALMVLGLTFGLVR
jgi:peptidoglycan/LPS O-acetylase OafA/YrhL